MRHPEPRGAGTGGSRAKAGRRGRARVRCGLKIPPGRPAPLGGVGCRRGDLLQAGRARAVPPKAPCGTRRRLSAVGRRGRGPARPGEESRAAPPEPGSGGGRPAPLASGRPAPPSSSSRRGAGPSPPRRAPPLAAAGAARPSGRRRAGSHPPLSFVRGAAAAGTVRGSAPSLRRAPLPRAVRGRAPASRRPPAAPVPAGLHFLPSPPPLFAGRRPPLTGCGLLRHCFRSRLGSRRSFILSPT